MNKKHQIIIAAFVLLSLAASSLFIGERVKFSGFKDQSQQTISQLTVAKQSAESATAKLKSDFDILLQKSQAQEAELKTQGTELTNRQALYEQLAKDCDKLSKDYDQALDAARQSEQLAGHYEKVSREILDAWKKSVDE